MIHPTEQEVVEVAKIIDPGEWLGPGPNPFGRRDSLAKARTILARRPAQSSDHIPDVGNMVPSLPVKGLWRPWWRSLTWSASRE